MIEYPNAFSGGKKRRKRRTVRRKDSESMSSDHSIESLFTGSTKGKHTNVHGYDLLGVANIHPLMANMMSLYNTPKKQDTNLVSLAKEKIEKKEPSIIAPPPLVTGDSSTQTNPTLLSDAGIQTNEKPTTLSTDAQTTGPSVKSTDAQTTGPSVRSTDAQTMALTTIRHTPPSNEPYEGFPTVPRTNISIIGEPNINTLPNTYNTNVFNTADKIAKVVTDEIKKDPTNNSKDVEEEQIEEISTDQNTVKYCDRSQNFIEMQCVMGRYAKMYTTLSDISDYIIKEKNPSDNNEVTILQEIKPLNNDINMIFTNMKVEYDKYIEIKDKINIETIEDKIKISGNKQDMMIYNATRCSINTFLGYLYQYYTNYIHIIVKYKPDLQELLIDAIKTLEPPKEEGADN